MTQADPQLLSLLQKIAHPISELNLNIVLKGVFAPPEQWKITDQANPNIFTYSVQFLNNKFTSGKIQPKKGNQPNAGQPDDKNKKGGKKQVKQQQKVVEQDPQAIRKRQQWQALPQEQRFYRTSEDPEKTFSLKFCQTQKNQQLSKQQIQAIQQTVSQGKTQIILTRKPQISQDQIAKLKKSKSKTLNVGQLYEAKYKGILDLSKLQTPGETTLKQRVKLSFFGDLPADGVKIETQNAYAYIEISLDKPLSPEVVQIKPQLQQVLPNIDNLSKNSINVIQKLKKQITRAIKAVNQEYITFFSKQKDFQDQKKNTGFNSVSTLRLNEINKRKELFLNQFANSGKFNILKQRIGKTIKAIIVDKFRKQKTAQRFTKQQIHRTLSELNVFFQQFVFQTIDYVLTKQNASIHEDILLNHQSSKGLRKQSIATVITQTKQQRQIRIAQQYSTINNIQKTQEKYLNLVLLNKQDSVYLQKYAQFLSKNKKFDVAYEIYKKINSKSNDLENKFILCLFMVQRRRTKQALQILTQMINTQQSSVSQKILYNILLSFMYEIQGDILRSEKYLAMAQKYFQIKKNPHLKINPPRNPYIEPRPLIPKPERYTSQLTNAESQQMITQFIQILQANHFYDLVEKILPKLNESNQKLILIIKVKLFNEQFEECLTILDDMLEKEHKNLDLLEMKAQICYKYDKIFQCEEVLLLILKQKPSAIQSYKAYLRLGYTYIYRKSWQDAKVTFQKVCQLKPNCSVGWLGLGISQLELKQLKQAQQSFSMCSIYNPLSSQTNKYIQKINEIRKKQNQSLYKYLNNN